MKKRELEERMSTHKTDTKEALELVLKNVNKGQKKKIVENPEVKRLIEIYNVEYDV